MRKYPRGDLNSGLRPEKPPCWATTLRGRNMANRGTEKSHDSAPVLTGVSHHASAHRQHNSMAVRRGPKFLPRTPHGTLDSAFADDQPFSDLVQAQPVSQQAQTVTLLRRQVSPGGRRIPDAEHPAVMRDRHPHAIKRASTDQWYAADPSATAAHIVSHARLSVTIRSYLDRVKVLTAVAPNLPIPEAFGGTVKRDDDAEFLKRYRQLSERDREQVRAITERLVG